VSLIVRGQLHPATTSLEDKASMRLASLIRRAALAFAVLLGIAVSVWLWRREPARADKDGFQEMAEAAGIHFRMNFLPDEQGARFKINLYDHGCGVAVGDFDGDGHEDIYFCNQLGRNALYRNKGDGTFEDVTDKAGVALGDRICVGATWADTRNKGLPDLFVTSTRGGNVLFRNNGDGTFTDVTDKAGLKVKPATHSHAAVFFDFDNDGFLDLLVTNTAKWTTNALSDGGYYAGKETIAETASSEKEYNLLYHNNGNGTFTEVTEKAGLRGLGWAADATVFDYDGDGWLDVLITNMFGRAQLYRNNGNGTFTDVTLKVLGKTSWGGLGARAFDFNNDGRLDLLIVDMHSDMWLLPGVPADPGDFPPGTFTRKFSHVMGFAYEQEQEAREKEKILAVVSRLKYNEVLFGNTLFKKVGGNKFEEVSDKAGMETWWPWGIATGDFDNDGFEDVFLPSGMGYPFQYWPNALMMNNGDETFSDRAAELGVEPPPGGRYLDNEIGGRLATRSSRAAAAADFTNSGRLDLIVNNFNDRPYYFRNHFPRKNYISFRLQGTKSNRDAIGALVHLHMGKEVMVRQVHAAGGYLSQSSRTLHFGLGDRDHIDRVEILWPRGLRETIDHPAINTRHELTEGK
jgi:hypothetical protein